MVGGKRKGKDYFGLSWEKDDHEAVYSTRPLGINYVATKVSGTLPGATVVSMNALSASGTK